MAEEAADRDFDPEVFRDVVGRFATGVTVITASYDGVDHGMTASAMTSLSLDPPMVLVCVNRSAATREAVSRSGVFGVNILHEDQADLAVHFARSRPDKFAGVAHTREPLGTLRLGGALGFLECEVVEDVAGGTHSVFFGKVRGASVQEGRPLAYFRGGFGGLFSQVADPLVVALRERLLTDPGPERLDPTAMARELGAEPSEVRRALATLVPEGVVAYDADHGFERLPVDAASVERLVDARTALEMGAVSMALTSGRVPPRELAARIVAAAEEGMLGLGEDPTPDPRSYARSAAAVHEALIESAGSEELLAAYRRLAIPGVVARALAPARHLPPVRGPELEALVRALGEGDVAAATQAIHALGERAKAMLRAALGDG